MQIKVTTTIPYPIDAVFEAMRDKLPEMAQYMPNVDEIIVEQKDESTPGHVRFVNRWVAARTEIPAPARPFVDQSRMYYHDHADWSAEDRACQWRLVMGFMSDRIKCAGTTSYHSVGESQTEMRILGALDLDLKGMVPRLLIGKVTSGVESFVGKLIEPNFQKTADALTAYLDAQAKQA
ncbi:MAG: hypothetical protein KC620_00950 [Myxococcales bacterium]|nr:hypothetical protein [Myxococcales bacterium]